MAQDDRDIKREIKNIRYEELKIKDKLFTKIMTLKQFEINAMKKQLAKLIEKRNKLEVKLRINERNSKARKS